MRGFSEQNAIKSHLRNRLNLTNLDALMRVSLYGLEVNAMDWAPSSTLGEICETEGHFRSMDNFLFDAKQFSRPPFVT